MSNLASEIVKKATLLDLIQEVKQGKELKSMFDDGELKDKIWFEVYFRNAARGFVRIMGNSAAVYGFYNAYADSENFFNHMLIGIIVPGVSYFLEDRFLKPSIWRKNDPQ